MPKVTPSVSRLPARGNCNFSAILIVLFVVECNFHHCQSHHHQVLLASADEHHSDCSNVDQSSSLGI
jgi:hypothetical protein